MYSCTVFVVDDEQFPRALARRILETVGFVVETFESAEALLSRTNAHDRGCVVLDLKMSGMGGLELQKTLSDRGIRLPIIFMSDEANIPNVVAAMKQGASDFLMKPLEPTTLVGAVEIAVRQNEQVAMAQAAVDRMRDRWESLSKREQQVCELFSTGMLIKQVAAELGTRESTIHIQRNSAYKKLGISSVLELVRWLDRIRHEG